ncbi:tellurite resistance TerB C-terminal domain-containing protein [Gynurincola endophyticus]|uniref:tellurite resistance TerB C-terminal domain-containing protein n=1 Tax=Gynurincola endophyticus TaxID=2479004 RepID=UPI0013154F9F|nr:tellurite resistance TerB C-terminal domain-containing protein [Gynurincola endophyticus]
MRTRKSLKETTDEEYIQHILNNIKVTITHTDSKGKVKDSSIIDVTGKSQKINHHIDKKKPEAPYWAHDYIKQHTDIDKASVEQKSFYKIFRDKFIKGEYLEIGKNVNYASVLLLELLNDYEKDKNIVRLESQLKLLAQNYPRVESAAINALIKKMEERGDDEEAERIKTEIDATTDGYDTSSDFWRLGRKYNVLLNLDNEQASLLDRITHPTNNFCDIEFCLIATVKLYVALIDELRKKYKEEGSSFKDIIEEAADIIVRKEHKYRKGSNDYKYFMKICADGIHTTTFQYCENAVRIKHGYNRKINTDTGYSNKDVNSILEEKYFSKVKELLPALSEQIELPDQKSEVALNAVSTTRWKKQFEELTTVFDGNAKKFVESVINLGKLNKKNPSVENIFFEASKFISKSDRESAISLYLYYLHYDLKSASFNNKQLTKTIQKSLFQTNEQLHAFEKIVSDLIHDKDLKKALRTVPVLYEVKRKKIKLDSSFIKEARQQHSETVELLNEYLKDDFEDDNTSIKAVEINSEEVKMEIVKKNELEHASPFVNELVLNNHQTDVIGLFVKSNFSLAVEDFEIYSKTRGLFSNQLIESINETCYELLDDLLIEEEEGFYTINPNYFQRISAI